MVHTRAKVIHDCTMEWYCHSPGH